MEYIKIDNGVVVEEPLPQFLREAMNRGEFGPEGLRDLRWLGAPDYENWAWYPLEDRSPALQRYQDYTENKSYTIDADRFVVVLVYEVHSWTAQEIHEWKASTQRRISYAALRRRFTHAERVALEVAALDAPTGDQDVRRAAAEVRVLERDLASAKFIDLNLDDVQANIQLRETLGLIAAGRADEVIWGDIEPDEVV